MTAKVMAFLKLVYICPWSYKYEWHIIYGAQCRYIFVFICWLVNIWIPVLWISLSIPVPSNCL